MLKELIPRIAQPTELTTKQTMKFRYNLIDVHDYVRLP
jgi:hypothetical protein